MFEVQSESLFNLELLLDMEKMNNSINSSPFWETNCSEAKHSLPRPENASLMGFRLFSGIRLLCEEKGK